MKKYSRLIIIAAICTIIIAIICIILIMRNSNKQDDEITVKAEDSMEEYNTVSQIKDVQKTYNIEKMINKHLSSRNELKVFTIQDVYEGKIGDNVLVYFTEGYLMYDDIDNAPEGNISRQDIQIILIKDKESNKYTLETYGSKKLSMDVKYSDNIAETQIKKVPTEEGTLHWLYVDGNRFLEDTYIDKNVTQADRISWCYKDYKNKKLFETQDRNEYKASTIKIITENEEEGYTVILNDNSEITIKLGEMLKDYEISK